jgi:hypothetical protein
MSASHDALGRCGDPWAGTPLQKAFADAEVNLLAILRDLVTTDEQARAFVRRWRTLVETTDEYPQRRGAVFARTDEATFTWDVFVVDEAVVTGYRVLGTVVED